ncbi:hypothetical protein [Photobacterium angustum]|uniref:Uncharacterized protein n=1 Tax=Photobacterium angustum TaxID=661 RepID=A0A2S7VYY5_PHOAN|nr:hypothetical protein [Photobacterium angustum]PQJ67048.1 hypothetical protein BTO08_06355 [Photobacterium angustum]
MALKLDYVLGLIEIAKDIYLDKRIKSVSKSIYYGALVIYLTAMFTLVGVLLTLIVMFAMEI